MKILLCNDDGIHAPGITSLYAALLEPVNGKPLATELMVVAPLTVQSATSHGITFRQPLIVKQLAVSETMSGVAVDGRPADCVKLALSTLWPEQYGAASKPDLVISGMNMGANVGINVLYSGTVAAAIEAAFLGVPAIAVSLHHGTGSPDYAEAARQACLAIEKLLAAKILEPHGCLSINIPRTDRTTDGTPGRRPMPPVTMCAMNSHGMIDKYQRNTNPLGELYFWASGEPLDFHVTEPGTDVHLIWENHITVTPLKYDLTDYQALDRWRAAMESQTQT